MAKSINVCLYCTKPIKSGRTDKKFCDAGCKDAYNNALKTDEHKEIRKIDLILKRNRRILKSLYDPKKADSTVTREKLIKAGFEFGFHTHAVITRFKSNEITFCYDYGYRETTKDKFQLFPSFSKVQVKGGDLFKI